MQNKKDVESIKNATKEQKETKYNFLKRCLSDKLYIICFTITILFFLIIASNKIHQNGSPRVNNSSYSAVKEIAPIPSDERVEELDISDYVGVYSRTINMNTPIRINAFCTIESYKYIYQIKSDKTINKYYYNSCIGSVLIKNDKLSYVNYSGSKYIGTEEMNFTFEPNILKEVDGYIYKIDEDIVVIKEDKRLNDVNLDFYADNIVITTKNNIYLVQEKDLKYELNDEYLNTFSPIDKTVYKSNIKYQYNFITYKEESNDYCYTFTEENENTKGDIVYYIYSVRYDVNANKFMDIKEVIARTKEESCANYEKDLNLLNE